MPLGPFPSSVGDRIAWWRLRRHPLLFWSLAGSLSLVTGISVTQMLNRAEGLSERFGKLRPVLIATKPIIAGSSLGSDNTELRSYPSSFIPEGALRSASDGALASEDLQAGEPVVQTRLAPEGLSATASLIPQGGRAIAIPSDGGTLPLARGDRVDVLATMGAIEATNPSQSSERQEPTFRVARDATVISYNEQGVTIAVSEEEAIRVAYALSNGIVTLVLNGP